MDWDFSVVWFNSAAFAKALFITVRISLFSIAIGTILGTSLAMLGLARSRVLRVAARAFVEIFLAIPALVLLVWLYYSLPLMHRSLVLSGESAAILGLGFSLSAFVAEIVRAGVAAIPSGELEAAYCTGMTKSNAIRHILLPQVFRRSWPPLVGQYITTYKFSTLASVLAVHELLHTANTLTTETFRPLELYTAVAVIFLATVVPMNLILHRVERARQFGGITRL